MSYLIRRKMLLFALVFFVVLFVIELDLGVNASKNAMSQFLEMLKIVPPIFLMIGLMDVWVPRETMIKIMGEKSGAVGLLIAFMFGTFAAGPLVGAFPVAMVMLKKGAKYSNVMFFLMIWASAKLPIVFFQVTTMGVLFTVVMNVTLILVYLIGVLVVEKFLSKQEIEHIVEKAKTMV